MRRVLLAGEFAFAVVGIFTALLSESNLLLSVASSLAGLAAICCLAGLLRVNRGRSYTTVTGVGRAAMWCYAIIVFSIAGYNAITIFLDNRAWHHVASAASTPLVAMLLLSQQYFRKQPSVS